MTWSRFGHCVGALWMLGVLLSACPKDDFECGVASGDDVHVCDGVAELCICAHRRCAIPSKDPSCLGAGRSGLRYVFGDEDDCVDTEDASSGLRQATVTGDVRLCPDERRASTCGVPGAAPCAAGQYCLCDENACVFQASECKTSSLAYVADATRCVELTPAEVRRQLTDASGLCGGYGPVACGIEGLGAEQKCSEGQRCHCPSHRCITSDDECDSSFRWFDSTGGCVMSSTTAVLCQSVPADKFCPTAATTTSSVSECAR